MSKDPWGGPSESRTVLVGILILVIVGGAALSRYGLLDDLARAVFFWV